MRVAGIPLGVGQSSSSNWDINSTHAFAKTNVVDREMLLTSSFSASGSNEEWLTTIENRAFPSNSNIRFRITGNNAITYNPMVNGLSHLIRARCYNSSDVFLGYVGFGYTLSYTGTQKYGVYVLRDVGGYIYSEQSSSLNVSVFNSSDIFELSVDVASKNWMVTKGLSSVDGDAVLGQLPQNTAYVKYQIVFFIGQYAGGTAEIQICSDV